MDPALKDRDCLMDVAIRRGPYGSPVVVVHGDVDFSNRDLLATQLELAGASRSPLVFLDLRNVEFMDSAAAHVIKRADESRPPGRLLIVRPPAEVARIFALAGLEARLTFISCLPGE